jgi:hypothetical protein
MAKINIYFEDLKQVAQQTLREAVQEELINSQVIDRSNGAAANEIIDEYISRCDFSNEFTIAEIF